MIARPGINYAARGASKRRLSFSLANFESIVALDVTAAFNERLPERTVLSLSLHVLPTREGIAIRGRRSERGGDGGGVGRARKTDRKGREVVSCRTLDEAHARCEAARAFMRAAIGRSGTRTTASPGRPRRPGRRRRRDLSPRGCPGSVRKVVPDIGIPPSSPSSPSSSPPTTRHTHLYTRGGHVRATETDGYRPRPNIVEDPQSWLEASWRAADWSTARGSGHRRRDSDRAAT